MNVAIPEIDEIRSEMKSLTGMVGTLLALSGMKKTVTVSDIARMEGIAASQLRKGGKERYLLPRFGQSGYPTGTCRWDISEYLEWSAIDPAERQRMWYEHLRSTARREAGRK